MAGKQILELLVRIADATVAVYGRSCEVAVHDLRDLEQSLVHIAGSVTGRKAGAPITDLAYTMLRERGDDTPDTLTYRTTTREGRTLQSTTTFVRDDGGHIRACLCINHDLTGFLAARAALDEFTLGRTPPEDRAETFARTVEETVEAIVQDCSSRMGKHPSVMTRDERVALTGALHARDVFRMRGAAEAVATMLGVTRYTVYNYLKEAKKRIGTDPDAKE